MLINVESDFARSAKKNLKVVLKGKKLMVKMFLFYKLRTTCKKSDSEWFLFKTANFDSHFLRTIGLINKMSVLPIEEDAISIEYLI